MFEKVKNLTKNVYNKIATYPYINFVLISLFISFLLWIPEFLTFIQFIQLAYNHGVSLTLGLLELYNPYFMQLVAMFRILETFQRFPLYSTIAIYYYNVAYITWLQPVYGWIPIYWWIFLIGWEWGVIGYIPHGFTEHFATLTYDINLYTATPLGFLSQGIGLFGFFGITYLTIFLAVLVVLGVALVVGSKDEYYRFSGIFCVILALILYAYPIFLVLKILIILYVCGILLVRARKNHTPLKPWVIVTVIMMLTPILVLSLFYLINTNLLLGVSYF